MNAYFFKMKHLADSLAIVDLYAPLLSHAMRIKQKKGMLIVDVVIISLLILHKRIKIFLEMNLVILVFQKVMEVLIGTLLIIWDKVDILPLMS